MADPKIKTVKIEKLTGEAFAPFGEVLEIGKGPPPWKNESGVPAWWMNFEVEGHTRLAVVHYEFKKPPTEHQIVQLEQHPRITETMIPLDGKPAIVYVAPPTPWGTNPDLDQLRAFLLDGTNGVMLNKMTWHARAAPCLLPVYPPSVTCIMVHEAETWDDVIAGTFVLTSRVNLPNDFGCVIQFTW